MERLGYDCFHSQAFSCNPNDERILPICSAKYMSLPEHTTYHVYPPNGYPPAICPKAEICRQKGSTVPVKSKIRRYTARLCPYHSAKTPRILPADCQQKTAGKPIALTCCPFTVPLLYHFKFARKNASILSNGMILT